MRRRQSRAADHVSKSCPFCKGRFGGPSASLSARKPWLRCGCDEARLHVNTYVKPTTIRVYLNLTFRSSRTSILWLASLCLDKPRTIFSAPMDSMNDSFGASSDPKTAILKQIQQEVAINNARQLIDVSHPRGPKLWILHHLPLDPLLTSIAENEQPLLPEMRTHARQLVVEKRGRVSHTMHGKIHGDVEHCQ